MSSPSKLCAVLRDESIRWGRSGGSLQGQSCCSYIKCYNYMKQVSH